MKRLCVCPITEGHGEGEAVPALLRRVAQEIGIDYLVVTRPIRQKRDRLLSDRFDDLSRATRLAWLKAKQMLPEGPWLVLLLVDSENECAEASGPLGPRLRSRMREALGQDVAGCVLAHPMFETWFVAGMTAQHPLLRLRAGEEVSRAPEADRIGKGWVKQRMPLQRYQETIDQQRLVRFVEVSQARQRSGSFDKLCRVLEAAAKETP